MKNDTISTYIWIILMALLILALRTADGGLSGAIEQIDTLFLAATTSAVSAPVPHLGAFLPLLAIGGVLAVGWAIFRSGSEDGASSLAARKYLALQYKLQAKDLDNG